MPNTNMGPFGDSDNLKKSVVSAVSGIVTSMEPQLNMLASRAATRAIDQTAHFAQLAYRKVRAQPWYLVGIATILLVGAAVLMGTQNRAAGSQSLS